MDNISFTSGIFLLFQRQFWSDTQKRGQGQRFHKLWGFPRIGEQAFFWSLTDGKEGRRKRGWREGWGQQQASGEPGSHSGSPTTAASRYPHRCLHRESPTNKPNRKITNQQHFKTFKSLMNPLMILADEDGYSILRASQWFYNLLYDIKAVTLLKALNPWVRCAMFSNVWQCIEKGKDWTLKTSMKR